MARARVAATDVSPYCCRVRRALISSSARRMPHCVAERVSRLTVSATRLSTRSESGRADEAALSAAVPEHAVAIVATMAVMRMMRCDLCMVVGLLVGCDYCFVIFQMAVM